MPLLTLALLLIVPIFIFVFRPRPTEAIRPAAAAGPLTAYQGFENASSLSPDGSQVAFSWNGPTLDNFDIYVKLVGPGEPIPVTKDPARDDNPSWSPDGKLIAFERFTAPDRADVYVVPALGGGERKVAVDVISESRFEMLNGSSGSLSWSPDGKWLAHRGGATEKGIWLSAVDGSGSRRLTETGSEPTFSEDGRSLAFVQRATAGFAVFVVPLAPGFVPAAGPKQVTPEAPIVRSVAGLRVGMGSSSRHQVFSAFRVCNGLLSRAHSSPPRRPN